MSKDINVPCPTPPVCVDTWMGHPFYLWCQRYIPIYWNEGLSLDENIGRFTCVVNELIKFDKELLDAWTKFQNDFRNDIEQIQDNIKNWVIANSDMLFGKSICNWLKDNMADVIKDIVKFVFFGLSTDGYFVAYIPNSWDFITFDTIIDPKSRLYGHLVLRW